MADDKKVKAAEPTPLEEACALACRHPKCHPKMANAIMAIPHTTERIKARRDAAKKSKK